MHLLEEVVLLVVGLGELFLEVLGPLAECFGVRVRFRVRVTVTITITVRVRVAVRIRVRLGVGVGRRVTSDQLTHRVRHRVS